MKNKIKRLGVFLCVLTLVIGSYFTANEFSVNASDTGLETKAVRDWTIFDEAAPGETTPTVSEIQYKLEKKSLGIDLSASYDEETETEAEARENLVLYMLVSLNSDAAVNTLKGSAIVELCNADIADNAEISWSLYNNNLSGKLDLHKGMNAICLKLSENTGEALGTAGEFSITSTINYFRIYTNTNKIDYTEGWSDIALHEVKIVDITPCVERYSSATLGVAPTPTVNVPSNYVFAGWFLDEECTSVLTQTITNGEAYAKFVDGDVLSVQAQYKTTLSVIEKTFLSCDTKDSLQMNTAISVKKDGERTVLSRKDNVETPFQILAKNTSVDISSYVEKGYLVFDMYIEDKASFGEHITSLRAHINSSTIDENGNKKNDGNYAGFTLQISEVNEGWYTYKLPLSEMATPGNADLTQVDIFRLSLGRISGSSETTTSTYEIRLDNIHFETDATNLRLITTVDSDMYQNVGFDITIGDKTIPIVSTTVYTQLYGVDSTDTILKYAPKLFSAQSEYFNTFTLGNVPISDKEIIVTPYWTTLDGTKVTGTNKTIIMSDVVPVE